MLTTVCLEGSCNLASFDIILDKNGEYVSIALENPLEDSTWKVNHDVFNELDFKKLNKIIRKEVRKNKSVLQEKVVIDAVSGATLVPHKNKVNGSAYTTKEVYDRVKETQNLLIKMNK
jgi:hypothetical protein